MNFQIGVEIDNSRIVWILESDHRKSGQVRLTTVSENQRKAIIKFYIKTSGKKHLLCTENITGIPLMHAGEPSIDIKAAASGKTLNYKIYLNGKPFSSSSNNIGKYIRSFKPLLTIAIIAAILTAALLAFFLLPAPGRSSRDTNGSSSTNILEQKEPVKNVTADTKTVIKTPPENKIEAIEKPELQTATEQYTEQSSNTKTLPVEAVFIESEITDRHSVYFQPDSAILTPAAISDLGSFINGLPKEKDFDEGRFEVEVRGHCARYGTEEGRVELSRERAVRVFDFLKSEWGLEADSVISGAGASEPVTLKREEQHLNRRVDINIKGNIKKIETSD